MDAMRKIGLKDWSIKDYVNLSSPTAVAATLSRIMDFSKFQNTGLSELQQSTDDLVCVLIVFCPGMHSLFFRYNYYLKFIQFKQILC